MLNKEDAAGCSGSGSTGVCTSRSPHLEFTNLRSPYLEPTHLVSEHLGSPHVGSPHMGLVVASGLNTKAQEVKDRTNCAGQL